MGEGHDSGSLRYAAFIAAGVVGLALLVCGALTLLPSQGETTAIRITTMKELAAAYDRVRPGLTRSSQLADLGFDTATANVQVLSYLGVMERFASDSRKFDRLDEALQTCVEARDRCSAIVYRHGEDRSAGGMLSSFGFGSANAAGRTAEVTLLLQDGRVAYKTISGVPQTLLAHAAEPVVVRTAAAPAAPRPIALPVSERSVY
jgi:hypothetical protein